MQSDYAWIKAMGTTPLVKAEPAFESKDVPLIGAGARAWGDSEAVNASPAQYDHHGSESESLTACANTAAFVDTDAPEVDSAAGTGVAASPLSPAAWPFVQREHADTPVQHPVPRRFSRKNRHPQRAREAVAEDWDYYAAPASQVSPLKIAGLKRKAGSDAESDGGPPPAKVLIASSAASAEPKFNRHGAHVCAQCGTSKTPMWRRFSNVTYCNACGLRKQRSTGGR